MKFFFFSLLLLVSCRSVKKSQEHTQLFQQRDSVEAYHEYRGESLLREWHSQEIALEVVPADSLAPAPLAQASALLVPFAPASAVLARGGYLPAEDSTRADPFHTRGEGAKTAL